MKYVRASVLTYDADIGRVEPGTVHFVNDDKAERWVNASIATIAQAPPQPDPEPIPPTPEPLEEPEEPEDEGDEAPEELAAEAHKLHDAGDSERSIAQKLGITRTRVHTLLASGGR